MPPLPTDVPAVIPGPDGTTLTADMIVPLVRYDPGEHQESSEHTILISGDDSPVLERWLGDLNVGYAYDTNSVFQYLRTGDLPKLGIKREDLRALSVRNLLARLPPVENHTGEQYSMLTAGGNFEISLLLADEMWAGLSAGADLYVAAPARDLVFWSRADLPGAYSRIAALVARVHADPEVNHKQSLLVLRWSAGGFDIAEASETH